MKSYVIISAVCEFTIPQINEIYLQLGDLRSVDLTVGFLNLDVRDQLIVIRSCIRMHSNLFKSKVPAFGKILYYELLIRTEKINTISKFNTKGKLITPDIDSFN